MEVEEGSRKTKPEMTAHGQNNLLVIRLECGMNTNNLQLPSPIVCAIIFLERIALGRSTSWEIHSKWLLLVSWDPVLFVIPAGPLSIFIQFLPFSSLLSWTFLLVEVHIFSQGETPWVVKAKAQCHREYMH